MQSVSKAKESPLSVGAEQRAYKKGFGLKLDLETRPTGHGVKSVVHSDRKLILGVLI